MSDVPNPRATFLALLALEAGPRHGYDIAAWLRERTGGLVSLSFGALYPVLHRLEREGLVRGSWEGEARRKKVYALTAKGRRSLVTERENYHAWAAALARLLGDA